MLNVQHVDVYTDFKGLAKLKTQTKTKSPEAIKEVARQFESIFVNRVLTSMRAAKLADGMLDSSQSQFYQQMYDQQLALHLSGDGGVGLAQMIVKQLSPSQDEQQQETLGLEDYLNRSASASRSACGIPRQGQYLPPPDLTGSVPVQFNAQAILVERSAAGMRAADKALHTVAQFISQLRPYAEQAATQLGVDAKLLLAQSALETGWGKSVINNRQGGSSHNLFNIKADKGWTGPQTQVATLEYEAGVVKKERAGFRAYASYADSFKDYVHFITHNPRYAHALKAVSEPAQYMRELQIAGYATDPAYAGKVMKIYHSKAFSVVESPSLLAMKLR